jgi:hypothetical protein
LVASPDFVSWKTFLAVAGKVISGRPSPVGGAEVGEAEVGEAEVGDAEAEFVAPVALLSLDFASPSPPPHPASRSTAVTAPTAAVRTCVGQMLSGPTLGTPPLRCQLLGDPDALPMARSRLL